jgi:hypothetical protein
MQMSTKTQAQTQSQSQIAEWKSIIIAVIGSASFVIISVTAIQNGYYIEIKIDGKNLTLEFNLKKEFIGKK